MNEAFRLAPFYARALLPISLLFAILFMFGFPAHLLVGFGFGYVWVMALFTPGLREQAGHNKYRFSFLRAAFGAHTLLAGRFDFMKEPWRTYTQYSIFPVLFIGVLYMLFGGVNPVMVLLGCLAFLGHIKLYERMGKKLV